MATQKESPLSQYGLEIKYFLSGLALTVLPFYCPNRVGYWLLILGIPMMGYAVFCYLRDQRELAEVKAQIAQEMKKFIEEKNHFGEWED
jgi:hypothetical protein